LIKPAERLYLFQFKGQLQQSAFLAVAAVELDADGQAVVGLAQRQGGKTVPTL